MKMSKSTIFVATHKKLDYDLPEIYRLCQVNAEKKGHWPGNYAHDNDSKDNISIKNDRYSELTALYDLWRNNNSDIKGLVHYRRFFSKNNSLTPAHFLKRYVHPSQLYNAVLTEKEINSLLKNADIILEYPLRPSIACAREDLQRFVYPKDVLILDEVIHHDFPDYEESYNTVMHATNISYLNMFVARREICDAYCHWLFDVLSRAENRLGDLSEYDPQHRRIFGYYAELLLNVWVLKNRLKIRHAFVLQLASAETETEHGSLQHLRKKLAATSSPSTLKVFFYSVPSRYVQLVNAVKHPYHLSLESVYSCRHSFRKLTRFYSRFINTAIFTDVVDLNGEPLPYHKTLSRSMLSFKATTGAL